jgi:hypothetical protein
MEDRSLCPSPSHDLAMQLLCGNEGFTERESTDPTKPLDVWGHNNPFLDMNISLCKNTLSVFMANNSSRGLFF